LSSVLVFIHANASNFNDTVVLNQLT